MACTPLRVTEPSLVFSTTQLPVGERGDLRQVGDDHDLRGPGQPGQPPADLDRRLAADARVDLVEEVRRHRVGTREDDLDREHHPRQLTAGGALGDGPRRRAGVRGEQQLDLVGAVRPVRDRAPADLRRPSGVLGLPDREGHPGVRHGQRGQLLGDGVGEPLRGLRAGVGQRLGQRGQFGAQRVALGGQLADPVVVAVQLGEPRGALLGPGQHGG